MKKHTIVTALLIGYCLLLVKVMIFKDIPAFRIGSLTLDYGGQNGGHPANLVPFKTILFYLDANRGLMNAVVNLAGNILLLVPVGFLIASRWSMNWLRMAILGVAAGLLIELTQLKLKVGIFDIDDVMLNAVGVMLGYGLQLLTSRWFRTEQYWKLSAAMIVGVVAAGALLFIVYPKDELNTRYVIRDVQPDAGRRAMMIKNAVGSTDLCNGTGGTGKVVGVEEKQLKVRLNNGKVQTVFLSKNTVILNAGGAATVSDLKIGARVTLVIDLGNIASAVLVCNNAPRQV